MKDKFKIQEEQYAFPYHYIPHFDRKGNPQRYRILNWGLEYLCYMKHVEELVDEIKPESILDVGCGDGRLTGILAQKYTRVVGCDLSKKAIMLAQAMNDKGTYLNSDAGELNEVFDVVIAMEVLEHIPDNEIATFLETLDKRTKMGGKVIITVPSTVKKIIAKHYRHYNLELFKMQLDNAKTSLVIKDVKYIYKEDLIIKLYKKLFYGKYLLLESKPIVKYIWRRIWNKNRFGDELTGRHLVVILNKGN